MGKIKKISLNVLLLGGLLFVSDCPAQYYDKDASLKTPNQGQSQGPPPAFRRENIFWGGDLGAYFSLISEINIAPTIGYRLNERLEAGIRANYLILYGEGANMVTGGYGSTSYYGGSVYGRFNITPVFFLQAEYEILNVPSVDFFSTRTNVDSRLVGGGIRRQIGEHAYYLLTILWDMDYMNLNSPYNTSPLILRIGFNFGL